MKKSISKRIKITKTGKLRRRARGLGHSKTNKNANQLLRKKGERTFNVPRKVISKAIKN